MSVNVESANIQILIDFSKFDQQLNRIKQKLAGLDTLDINAKVNADDTSLKNIKDVSGIATAGLAATAVATTNLSSSLVALSAAFSAPSVAISEFAAKFNTDMVESNAALKEVNAVLKAVGASLADINNINALGKQTEATKQFEEALNAVSARFNELKQNLKDQLAVPLEKGATVAIAFDKTELNSFKNEMEKLNILSNKAAASIKNIGPAAQASGSTGAGAFLKLGTAIKGLISGPLAAIIGAVALIRKVFQGISNQAIDDAAFANLNTTLQKTGGLIKVSVQQAETLAQALDSASKFELDKIREAQSILATFTNIKGVDLFGDTINTAADLATVLGTDLKSATVQLGKALNDPIKGINALSRSGVSFSEGEKAKIKTLVETNRTLEAQRLILKTIADQGISGQSKNINGFDKLKKATDDLFKSFGTLLSGMLGVPSIVEWLAEKFNSLSATFKAISENKAFIAFFANVQAIFATLSITLEAAAGVIIESIKVIFKALTFNFSEIDTEGFKKVFDTMITDAKAAGDRYRDTLQNGFNKPVDGKVAVVLNTDTTDVVDATEEAVNKTTDAVERQISILNGASSVWENFATKIGLAKEDLTKLGAVSTSDVNINSSIAKATGLDSTMTGVITAINNQTSALLGGMKDITTAIKGLNFSPVL